MPVKLKALHTVSVVVEPGVAKTKDTPAKAPKSRNLAPGTIFAVDDEEAAILIEAGAAEVHVDKPVTREPEPPYEAPSLKAEKPAAEKPARQARQKKAEAKAEEKAEPKADDDDNTDLI
jgi:hypothetical protein